MLATRTPLVPSLPPVPLPRRRVIVPANLDRRRPQASPEDGIGGVGFVLLTALKSDPPASSERQLPPEETSSGGSYPTGKRGSLSGSDVLLALQKAAARKRVRGKKGKRRIGGGVAEEDEDSADYSDVRPLNIRRDWAPRLDELQRAVDELRELGG